MRSKYEGIIVGPIPHSMRNGFNLIRSIETDPQNYPPFIVTREKEQHLKMTKNLFKKALDDLSEKMKEVDNYAVV